MVNSPSPHDDITVGETVRNKNLLWGSKKQLTKPKHMCRGYLKGLWDGHRTLSLHIFP